jgi:RNA-directed DNA polymerase
MPTEKHRFTRNLAAALLSGEWRAKVMSTAAAAACGKRHRWIWPLVRRVLRRFEQPPPEKQLVTYLESEPEFNKVWQDSLASRTRKRRLQVAGGFSDAPAAEPVPVAATLPDLPTTRAVADWLGLTRSQLDWFADRWNDSGPGKFYHYRHRWVPKRSRATTAPIPPPSSPPPPPAPGGLFGWLGGLFARPAATQSPPSPPAPPAAKPSGFRLLEIPKVRLKRIQRTILCDILSHVPPHPAAHAFRPGRSILANAAPHCGQVVVLKFDLADFFPSIPYARVHSVFRSLGYPPEVASVLAGLCTTRLPWGAWRSRPQAPDRREAVEIERRFLPRHLPQGAPTSPALANLCAYHLDCRLAGLAAQLGATYTRYADDLTFSGGPDLRRAAARVRKFVTAIAVAEGFVVNATKTRVVGRGGRQTVTGVVVNARPNVRRDEFDRLKAILTNCVRHGPASQNREKHPDFRAHLVGRISHVALLNPARGARLRAIFSRIDWSGPRG